MGKHGVCNHDIERVGREWQNPSMFYLKITARHPGILAYFHHIRMNIYPVDIMIIEILPKKTNISAPSHSKIQQYTVVAYWCPQLAGTGFHQGIEIKSLI